MKSLYTRKRLPTLLLRSSEPWEKAVSKIVIGMTFYFEKSFETDSIEEARQLMIQEIKQMAMDDIELSDNIDVDYIKTVKE